MNSKVIKNYLYNVAYQILVILTPIITTPYLSRVLGAEGIGVFGYAQSISTYFVLFGTAGSALYGQREIAYVQNDTYKKSQAFIEIVSIRLFTILISLIVYGFIFMKTGDNILVYRFLAIEIFASGIDISWYFQGMEDFKLIFIRNFVIKVASLFLIFTMVRSANDLPFYVLCYALPILVGNLSLWTRVIKEINWKVPCNFVRHIKPILVFFLPQIATEVYTVLDKTMIGLLSESIKEVAYYIQAQKLVKMSLCVISSMGTVMLSAIAREFHKNNVVGVIRSILKSYRFVYCIGIPMMFGIIGISENMCPWFFGNGFDIVTYLMPLMSPLIVIIGMSNVTGRQYLLPIKKQREYTISVCIGAGTNFMANLILIPLFNATGACIATLFAEMCVTTSQLFMVRKEIPIKKVFNGLSTYCFAGTIMCISVWGMGRILPSTVISTMIQICCGGCVYVGGLLILRDEMIVEVLHIVKNKIEKKNQK